MTYLLDWKWSIIYFALSLLTVWFAWRTPARKIAIAISLNVVLSFILSEFFVPAEGVGAVNTMTELIVLFATFFALLDCPGIAGLMILLSTVSCVVSLGYSGGRNVEALPLYEETVNGILMLQCFIVMNTGLWGVVGNRAGGLWRWRRHRRRASHAGLRARLAAGKSDAPAPGMIRLLLRRGVPPRG